MPIVRAVYAPNGPNLIAPELFGGAGADTVQDLESLDLLGRVRPEVILVATPHWVSRGDFLVHTGERPRQLYDFSGFPPKLSAVKYEPPGYPRFAEQLVKHGRSLRLPVSGTTEWGLDHGAWAPLLHLAPGARIPVIPLSITPRTAQEHRTWGEAIRTATDATELRILFVSTGSITHSFRQMQTGGGAPWPAGAAAEQEIVQLIVRRQYDAVANFDPQRWAMLEPEGDLNPFFIMTGAIGAEFRPRLVSSHQVWGAFGSTIIDFEPS
jgi:4,5-DOPA dioxygenase extradiol